MTNEHWEKELDDILLDYCAKKDCDESKDHAVLKDVVRERLVKLIGKTRSTALQEVMNEIPNRAVLVKSTGQKMIFVEGFKKFLTHLTDSESGEHA